MLSRSCLDLVTFSFYFSFIADLLVCKNLEWMLGGTSNMHRNADRIIWSDDNAELSKNWSTSLNSRQFPKWTSEMCSIDILQIHSDIFVSPQQLSFPYEKPQHGGRGNSKYHRQTADRRRHLLFQWAWQRVT